MKKRNLMKHNLPYHIRNFPKVAAVHFVRKKLNNQLQEKDLGIILWKDNLASLKSQFLIKLNLTQVSSYKKPKSQTQIHDIGEHLKAIQSKGP